MKRGRSSGGYTIIEVMIFLAVSGFMFVAAAGFIQGKQTNAQFNQAINTMNSNIEQIINEVSDNNYLPNGVGCSTNSGSTPTFPETSTQQGANQNCVFMGKILQFDVGGNPQSYNEYVVAGCQFALCTETNSDISQSSPPTSFVQAKAQVVDAGTSDNDKCVAVASAANLTACDQTEWGLQATDMWDYNGGAVRRTNSVGFFNSFTQSNGAGLVGGSQNIDVLDTGFNNVNFDNNLTETAMTGLLNSNLLTATTSSANPYYAICFKDGSGNVGELVIGGNGNSGNLTTTVLTSQSPIDVFNDPSHKCS